MSPRELLVYSQSRLFASAIGVAECVEWSSGGGEQRAEAVARAFQIGFPYRGASVWQIAGDTIVADPNQVLFIEKGDSLRFSSIRSDGFAQLIITPAESVLYALTAETKHGVRRRRPFATRTLHAPPPLQRDCARFLHAISGTRPCRGPEMNAALLSLMRHALALTPSTASPSPQTQLLIRRTKEFVNATPAARLDLSRIATTMGVSAAYLTDVFRRVEGVPLQRYVTQLRLSRALNYLPQARDPCQIGI